LRYKGMLGFGDVVLEGSSFASIGNPAAHHRLLCCIRGRSAGCKVRPPRNPL
jgi:hypothetical protein